MVLLQAKKLSQSVHDGREYPTCLRCKPLLAPNQKSEVIERLISAVEEQPEKRWKDRDFKELGVGESSNWIVHDW